MQLKLRLLADDRADDVLVEADPYATIGELAVALFPDAICDAAHPGELGLVADVDTPARRVLAPATRLDRSGLRSGCSLSPGHTGLASPSPAVGTVEFHDGPDAPCRRPLRAGVTTIGRGHDRDVRVTDELVSQRHAELIVGDTIEIVDTASSNGVMLNGRPVDRAVLRPDDRVTIGATTISATLDRHGGTRSRHANDVPFNRSPRLDPRYEGVVLVAPEPPQPPTPQRFPIATLLAPIAMAGIIYAITGNVLTILFVALSPMMMIGSWWEHRSTGRKQLATATANFRSGLADLAAQLEYAQDLERSGRCAEHPSVVDVIEAVEHRSSLVWTRRPEHETFGQVRLGLGTQPSRTTVELPSSNVTLPELWRELNDTVAAFATVSDVPIVGDVRSSGNVGIGGPDAVAAPVVRGLIAQYVALHSPAELQLWALAADDRWAWCTWLPHTAGDRLAGDAAEASALAARLEAVTDARSADREPAGDSTVTPVPLHLVVVHDDAPFDRARLVQVAERGPDVGVHVVWSAPSVERLPAACRTFVDLDANTGRGRAGFVRDGSSVGDLAVEPSGAVAVARLARTLSPMVDAGAPVDTNSELPRSVAFVDLVGHDLAVSADTVIGRWRSRSSPSVDVATPFGERGLRAVVGETVDGPLQLDLRSQGPHALVGGTTGSGKSEFLQSWMLGLAAEQSPERVTFLLVDYKGGAAFASCVDLPHCVGLVTDLSQHLVRRALRSLDAELRYREQLLHDKRAKDLIELERRGDEECPPSLVIVVDEFAALIAEVPDFVDGVVNIAQRGRSLGLHLVLATQRPAGVIKDNLRANTNLRIALRMADEADSSDVIGSDLAARFDHDIPGRAVVKAGPGRAVAFQAAYVGGHHAGHRPAATIEVATLRFGRPVRRSTAPVGLASTMLRPATPTGPTDLERIVRTIGAAATRSGMPAVRRPWLPALADRYRLESLPTARTDESIVFGVADLPDEQQQRAIAFRPDVDGNLVVYGTGGTGKSGCLRSIGLAAGLGAVRGGPVWVYGIDFGSRGLQPLAGLPYVGSVIAGDDRERLQRLLRMLESTIAERSTRYAAAEASTISEYRRRTGAHDEARIIVLVDGVGAFRSEFEAGPSGRWWDLFVAIAAEGRALGVHVVMSADRPAAVPSTVASSIQRTLVLRLANDMDYAVADVPPDAFGSATPPGRGFLDGCEVQVAVIGGEAELARQCAAIDRCSAAMSGLDIVPAPPIGSLPTRVALTDLPSDSERPTIGVSDESLGATGFVTSGVFLVAGAPSSGVSTTVATMVRSLADARPGTEFVLLGQRRSLLTTVTSWVATAEGAAEIAAVATRLCERLADARGRSIVVVVEAIGELLNTEADVPLCDLLRVCRDHGVFVIAEGETSTLTGSWPLLQAVKAQRSGIVLQPDQMDGDTLFTTPFPRVVRSEFPAGRGLMVQGGRVDKVQVALPE